MEIRQLRAFVQVADLRHFGRAADTIGLTQPALSQRIHQLEQELGVRLLERTSRDVRLSAAGETLLPHARALLEEEARARSAMRSLAAGATGHLRLSYYLGGGLAASNRLVSRFRNLYPGVELETSFGYSAPNVERLRAGEVDAALVRLPMHSLDHERAVLIEALPYVLALPSGHPLTRQRRVNLAALAGEAIVIFPREFNPGQYDYLVGGIEAVTGKPVRIGAERPAEEGMIAAVSEGMGVCLCSTIRAKQMRVAGVAYRPLISSSLTAQLGLVVRADESSPIVQNLVRLAIEQANEMAT